MAASFDWKVVYDTAPGTTQTAPNCNYMSIDSYDQDGTEYADNPITVSTAATTYSYERWLRGYFSGSFNSITSMVIWHNGGTMSDGGIDLLAGTTADYASAVNSASPHATFTLEDWNEEGEALSIQPTSPTSTLTEAGYSDYLVQQLSLTTAVTTPGDIPTQTITMSYYED